jgi:hypothetical protein
MGTSTPLNAYTFFSPAKFRIEVKGKINKDLSDLLGALEISYSRPDAKIYVSRLEGEIIDQAALVGILNTLYEMRFPIISIKVLLP